jgi:hypothetical protein
MIPRPIGSMAKSQKWMSDCWRNRIQSLTDEFTGGRFMRVYFAESSRNQFLAVVFLAVSVADLLMTYVLLQTSPQFYESNPVANWAFQNWNMLGMTIYKFVLAAIVVTVCEVIERRRPGWGKFVLAIGCLATMFAFAKGLRFYLNFPGH